jgi:hypothetical protein
LRGAHAFAAAIRARCHSECRKSNVNATAVASTGRLEHRPLEMGMTATTPEPPFEKTIRLVCRLDDADIDYVRDTAEWIRRCVARVVALNPAATAAGVTAIVVDMSTRGRWRLMRPETVGEQLALPTPPVHE